MKWNALLPAIVVALTQSACEPCQTNAADTSVPLSPASGRPDSFVVTGTSTNRGFTTNVHEWNLKKRPAVAATSTSNRFEEILASVPGDSALDKQLAEAQMAVRSTPTLAAALERLGWLYVMKARHTFDDRFYQLAERTARELEKQPQGEASARLLRGHALHNQHRFREAEPIARELVSTRGTPFDHGLLGDVLMEMGRLDEAVVEYQKMMDLRPDSRALARAAHLRWLKGDLAGAVEAIQKAVAAVGTRDAESAAWMLTRLAFYQLASNQTSAAEEAADAALRLQTDYAPALFLLGRVRLAAGDFAEAIEPLQRAARISPLPEYQWALTDALREVGRFTEAREVEDGLRRHGLAGDARTFALFLATRREQSSLAVSLMRHELEQRADVFTHDALAWGLAAEGRFEEAAAHMENALSAGTVDGRLFFHAAVIAAKMGRNEEARRYREQAMAVAQLLLPSERLQLDRIVPATLPPPRSQLSNPQLTESRSPHPDRNK